MTGRGAPEPAEPRADGEARRSGFEWTLALCSAIEETVAAAESSDPRAFVYRGARLTDAVARALFYALINDAELRERFEQGNESHLRSSRSRLELAVAQQLLGAEPPIFSSRRRTAKRLRLAIAGLIDRARRRSAAGRARGRGASGVCFLIDHPKFMRFIAPLLELLGPERVLILSQAGDVVGSAEGAQPRQVLLDYENAPGSPKGRALGSGLREQTYLARDYDLLFGELAAESPACLVVIEGNGTHDELANRAAAALGIPCLCLQQGWSPIVHTGFRNMTFTSMAVWGEGFRDLLAPHNPRQRFAITGNPGFAAAAPAAPSLGEGRRCASFLFQDWSQLIGEEHLRGLAELVRIAAERFPADLMLVREHPGAPLSDATRAALDPLPNVRLIPPESHPLRQMLEASRVAVSIYSTTLLEAAALGIPALAYNTTSLPRYSPDLEEHGVGLETADLETALEALDSLLHDEGRHTSFAPAMERFRERFFAGADEHAPERITALIEEVARV